jgi:hypothetical protein
MATRDQPFGDEQDMTGQSGEDKASRVAAAREKLLGAPAKNLAETSLIHAISELLDDIVSCRHKGYTDMEICGYLKEAGIVINPATLKSYVHRIKSERGSTKAAIGNAPVSRARRQSVKPQVNKAVQQESDAAIPISATVSRPAATVERGPHLDPMRQILSDDDV